MDKVMEPVDVVIVGAGAAGSMYAAILAEARQAVQRKTTQREATARRIATRLGIHVADGAAG